MLRFDSKPHSWKAEMKRNYALFRTPLHIGNQNKTLEEMDNVSKKKDLKVIKAGLRLLTYSYPRWDEQKLTHLFRFIFRVEGFPNASKNFFQQINVHSTTFLAERNLGSGPTKHWCRCCCFCAYCATITRAAHLPFLSLLKGPLRLFSFAQKEYSICPPPLPFQPYDLHW